MPSEYLMQDRAIDEEVWVVWNERQRDSAGDVHSFYPRHWWAKIIGKILYHRGIGKENPTVFASNMEAKVIAIQEAKKMNAISLD